MAIEKTMPIEVRLVSKCATSAALVDAGRVHLADAQVDGEGGRWDQPAVVTGGRDGALAVEYGEGHASSEIVARVARKVPPVTMPRRGKVETSTVGLRRGRGAAGRYVETVGSPSTQNRHGRSAALRRPTRGPVATGCAAVGPRVRVSAPADRSAPSWPRSIAEGLAEPGRPPGQVPVAAAPAAAGHLETVDDLAGPQQHRRRRALGADHHVAAVVHPVGEVDVEVSRAARTSPRCGGSARGGVRARVARSVVRLDLGEPDRDVAVPQHRAEQPRGDVEDGARERLSPARHAGPRRRPGARRAAR